jgi:hypothetical protein
MQEIKLVTGGVDLETFGLMFQNKLEATSLNQEAELLRDKKSLIRIEYPSTYKIRYRTMSVLKDGRIYFPLNQDTNVTKGPVENVEEFIEKIVSIFNQVPSYI